MAFGHKRAAGGAKRYPSMAGAIHNTPQEFWRPPIVPETATSGLVEVCGHCHAEFMAGARFCHSCGAERLSKADLPAEASWTRHLQFLHVLEFQSVKDRLGLSTAAMVSFLVGLGCILGAMLVGIIYSVQNFADFQAIQLWRMEWLLGALVAFVAGILLKRSGTTEK